METITQPKGMFNEVFYGLSIDELRVIMPAIKREYRHAKKMAEKYTDMVSSGYATDRQSTAMFDWQEKADKLERIIIDAYNAAKL